MTLTHRLFAQNVRDMRASPATEVEAASLRLLVRLLDHAARCVPYHAPISATLAAAAAGDVDAWHAIPVVTEDDLRRAGTEALASEFPEGEEALDERSWTSIASPVEGPLGLLADVADRGQWEFLLHSFDVDAGARLAAILPPSLLRPDDLAEPFGPWSLDAHRGRAHAWSEEFDAEATRLWLGHVRPACLFLRPAVLERLLAAARPGRLALSEVLLAGVARDPDARERCRAAFGARLLEAVVSPAGGFTASAGPPRLFVPAAETALVEIVDAEGRTSPPGEPGRLVGTALYGYRRPAIRLDLGLRAAWCQEPGDDPLACGRRCFRVLD